MTLRQNFLWTFLLFLSSTRFFPSNVVDAYRVGDAVDTVMYYRSHSTVATRQQMPLFGISRTVKSEGISGRFSLAFDEGLHALPQVEGKNLETLVVTFLYSKSGNGVIHSVSAQTIYKSSAPPAEIQIEYKWVEEEPVDIQSGATVMFLATLVVSVVFLFQACGLTSDDEDGIANGNHASEFSDSNIPKWGHSE